MAKNRISRAKSAAHDKKAVQPAKRGPILLRTRNLKMARSAHAHVRGSTVKSTSGSTVAGRSAEWTAGVDLR